MGSWKLKHRTLVDIGNCQSVTTTQSATMGQNGAHALGGGKPYRCWGVPAVFAACSDETRLHWFHASSMDLDTEFELIGILIGELLQTRPLL